MEITPDSALAYLYLADAELGLGDNYAALDAATRANELDMTLIPVYLALAKAYINTGQPIQADQRAADIHVIPARGCQRLAPAWNCLTIPPGITKLLWQILSKAIDANKRNPESYYQRGSAYLNLDSPNLAETDFKSALNYDPFDFDSYLGLARSYFMQGNPNNAYIEADQKALPLGTHRCQQGASLLLGGTIPRSHRRASFE